jgi:NAD(P)-dependent dehydrogenase (short-subunit alcohol dehydrogenase family)
VKPATLEVRDEAAAKAALQLAVDTFGRLEVPVNNAGYGQFAPFEQLSAEDFKAVVDTCFYGVVYTTRAAIPVMRKQKSGYIFQVSSVGGRLAIAGNTPYHAAKWAVGGFSDALAMEVAPFGVKICTLEPGGIRTNWFRRAGQDAPELLPDYEAERPFRWDPYNSDWREAVQRWWLGISYPFHRDRRRMRPQAFAS